MMSNRNKKQRIEDCTLTEIRAAIQEAERHILMAVNEAWTMVHDRIGVRPCGVEIRFTSHGNMNQSGRSEAWDAIVTVKVDAAP